jgi:superfamily II DNA or RNA helicase
MYIPIEKYDQFIDLSQFDRRQVSDNLVAAVRRFHEADELEELILRHLADPNRTPHGPAEIVDIMTLQLSHRKKKGVAGFILKGRSFKRVTPADVSHQIFRLRAISDLKFAILGHTGNLLDEAREEFIHTAKDLRVDYTIVDAADFACFAVIQGVLCPRDARKLKNGRCQCGYRVSGDLLNILQRDALKQMQIAHEWGQTAGVVIMPTGSGKTRIAAIDSSRVDAKRVLYIAHTHEILDGAEREFAHFYGSDAVHRGWKYNDLTPTPSIHLSTIQSISRSIGKIEAQQYDYLVVDEFHHAAAKSYRKLISQVKPSFLLGLTATPFRGDKQDVVELCKGNIIVSFELRTGIESGILTPYHYYGCFDDVDYSRLKRFAGVYSIDDLNKALIIPERDEAIIKKWRTMAEDLPTLAFCCSHEHAKRTVSAFRAAGVPAAEYLGTTPMEKRANLIEKLQYGELRVLCAVDVLNEGIDIPFVECLLFLRPTESKRIFFQQLGRGLRRSPSKDKVVVLDFIGNFHNAYRLVEYLGLQPEERVIFETLGRLRSSKQVINLPLGCHVEFDNRVIDIFANQILDPRKASRHNIAQILIFLYLRTSKRLRRFATPREIDRMQILHSDFYKMVFGSWEAFEIIMRGEDYAGLFQQ